MLVHVHLIICLKVYQWTITVPGAVIVSFEGNLHFNKLGTPFGTFDHAIFCIRHNRYGRCKNMDSLKENGRLSLLELLLRLTAICIVSLMAQH